MSISTAPTVEEFRPPSPTVTDPYPGYYMLPSGQWAMYDPAYYKAFSDKWTKEYEAQIRAYERGMDKGFEGAESEGTIEVNAEDQYDAARKEREERMALTSRAAREGEMKVPNMTINPPKTSGLARSRHQLSTLLTEAYTNREALEEKIAMAKRNRKESGNKYGGDLVLSPSNLGYLLKLFEQGSECVHPSSTFAEYNRRSFCTALYNKFHYMLRTLAMLQYWDRQCWPCQSYRQHYRRRLPTVSRSFCHSQRHHGSSVYDQRRRDSLRDTRSRKEGRWALCGLKLRGASGP